jgi:flagellar protein FliO/FliZ
MIFKIVLVSFFIFANTFLFSVPTDKDEMDKLLQNELGQSNSKPTEEVKSSSKKEAINPVEERFKPKEESSSLLWTLLKVFFIFGILTALMYYLLKFLSKTKESMFPVKNAMRVLSTLSIAPNKHIQIIDVSGMLFLIGVADSSISLLKEIDSAEVKEKIFHERDAFEPPLENFGEMLSKTFKNLDIKSPFNFQKKSETEEDEILDEIKQRQIDRLEKLKSDRSDLSNKKGDSKNFFE